MSATRSSALGERRKEFWVIALDALRIEPLGMPKLIVHVSNSKVNFRVLVQESEHTPLSPV